MGLFALAIAPGLAICIFIYYKDKYNKEPLKWLIICFILGMLSTIPAVLLQLFYGDFIEHLSNNRYIKAALSAFVVAAFSEELSKFIVVRYAAFPKKHFDEPFDGIVYAVMVSMGFATLENIGYVFTHGYATGIMRMFLSVPAHATFGILMGYYISLAKFNPDRKRRYFLLALFWAITFHGLFDFFLFTGKTILHLCGALLSLIVAVKLSRRAIRKKQEISRLHHLTETPGETVNTSLFNND